ncbi:MAG: hypothetical protein H7336_00980 [Bacteriovorax sp.]|nr:hypothetical protein [Bacteriovorax sp.]
MKSTKLLATCAVFALTTSSLFAADPARNKSLDRMMYTINPEIALSGPVFSDQSDTAAKTKYASDLVRLILKEADSQAKSYLEAGDTQAYYTALTMALTVPMQEGLYIQYRSVTGSDVCNVDANSGDLVKKAGEMNYGIFNQYFKTAQKPFFPNCSDIKSDKITQIIRGGDGTDLSIMQVSIRWHFDDFLANKKYESVQSTLAYGIRHLMKGFNSVYRNVDQYKCIAESGLFKKKKINYINLIRGVWAGQYNSGSITKTCRFDDSSSPFKGHDKGFSKNLDKVLAFNGVLSVDMVADFKLDADASAAFSEVVNNLKGATNNKTALDKILK